ncbi:alpha-1,3-arabinosyltransferase XAT3-like [Musa acuminata AAA Group]|uniref:alpha-1,3-arabinosyltransferase XAT3 n=1 Tax=Musa acuminata AAA Group TaxID=214697 RepID=UPI0031D6C312
MKMAKKFRPPVEPRSFGSGLIVGCFLVSMTYVLMSKKDIVSCLPSSRSLLLSSSPSWSDATPSSSIVSNRKIQLSGHEKAAEESNLERSEAIDMPDDSSPAASASDVLSEEGSSPSTDDKSDGAAGRKPMCDVSGYRLDTCDLAGDVRVIGKNSSSVVLVVTPDTSSTDRNESWQIKPYPRKYDSSAMAKVRPLSLKSLNGDPEAPRCSINHTVPGILFSTGGHCGNCFHDFADVLIPLFQTAIPFRGRVQFIITNHQRWWMNKYRPYLTKLSSYDAIDFDNDDRVHCFDHVIVGLRAERDLMIHPPNGGNYSIMDFVKLTRSAYSLERDRPWTPDQQPGNKPRLLFIARGGTRKFMNLDEIVPMAEQVGFEVVVSEPDFYDVARFAHIVNSCDVMVGVHGAGLTNFLFLPTDAIVIQVVPLGKLDWIATNFYAEPAMGMGLRYLEYNITVEESTLTELYPRDHPVFANPESIHKQGWFKLGNVFLKQQNVKLDVSRFRSVLVKALELLGEKRD